MSLILAALFVPAEQAWAESSDDESVSVKLGREVSVTFVQEGDRLTSPTILPEPTKADGVVTFKLARSGPARTLYVTNGFSQALYYRVRIRFRGRGGQVETVMAPVAANQQGVVSFADPIEELVLFDFRLKSSGASTSSP